MAKERKCNHKLTLPLYARGERNWVSSKKLKGKMIYICTKCKMIFDKGFLEIDEGEEK